jgi:hypothetical protein
LEIAVRLSKCLLALSASVLVVSAGAAPPNPPDPQSVVVVWQPTRPGNAFSFFTEMTRVAGSAAPLQDFTVAAQLVAMNAAGIHQWAFGVASEAIALPGSRSILVGAENTAINMEPSNVYPKIANNAVFKNRFDGGADPGAPMNANSIAYWITAQPGTGFERGLVFDTSALRAVNARPVAIDLSDIPDDVIGQIDLIRIRKDVALRYDPTTRQLVVHVGP